MNKTHESIPSSCVSERVSKKSLVIGVGALAATSLLLAGCTPADQAKKAPISITALDTVAGHSLPNVIAAAHIGTIEVLPAGATTNVAATAERIVAGSSSWIVSAGHPVKGEPGHPINCNTAISHLISATGTAIPLAGAGTKYTPSEGVSSSDDVSVLRAKNSRTARNAFPAIPLASGTPDVGAIASTRCTTYKGGKFVSNSTVAEYVAQHNKLAILIEPDTPNHTVPGNSGGPALNAAGQQFGVVTGVTSRAETLSEINTQFDVNLTGSSHEYWVTQALVIDGGTLGSLATNMACAFR
ncbi:MAG: trypsin-like peptidase domain-containing protein [Candidatus Saccharibacteria bacterium]